jgi:VWFA-related protein
MPRAMPLCLVVALTLPGSMAPAQEAPPVFRTGVDVITLPVRVLDSNGAPVERLDAGAFSVRIDGQPRPIVSVESVKRPGAGLEREPAQTFTYSTNVGASPRSASRTVLLVIDIGGLDTTAARQVAGEAERLLDSLAPEDRVGLSAIPIATVAVDPTTEREAVRAALRKVAGGIEPRSTSFAMSYGEAIEIEQQCPNPFDRATGCRGPAFEDVVARECLQFFGPGDKCRNYVHHDALLMARFMRESAHRRLRSLTALINALPATADLKQILLMTPGFFHDPGLQALYHELGVDLAARTATLSIIQVEGTEGSAEEARLLADKPDWRLLTTELQRFAGGASGDLLRLGTVATRFNRFQRESYGYYLLGISAEPGDLDGKSHEVSVAVSAPNVTIHHAPNVTRARLPERPNVEANRLAAVIRQAATEHDIPLGVQTTTFRGDDAKRLQVIMIVRVPQPAAKDATVGVEVRDGAKVVGAQTGQLAPRNQSSGVPTFVTTLLLPPGRYVARVAVVSKDGHAGSVDHPLAVTLAATGPVLTSGLVVGQARGGPVRPALDVSGSDPVSALLELYALEPDAAAPSVTFTLSSVKDPSVKREVRAEVQSTEVDAIKRGIASFDVTDLPPGDYLMRAEVQARGKRTAIDQHVVLHPRSGTAPAAAVQATTPKADIPPLVERAAAYVERYLSQLSNVVMDESYRQQQRRPGNMAIRTAPQLAMRTLQSEVLIVPLPPPTGPMAFRDVLMVDNRPVGERENRLQRLFSERHPSALKQAERVTIESARFNIGGALRTLNVPTVPLLFLRSDRLHRMKFRMNGEQELDGRRLARVRFEHAAGSTFRAGDVVTAKGQFWVDPLDGTVWRADLSITIPDATGQTSTPDLIGDISLVFQDHKEWGMLVPATMTERYVLRNGEEDDGRAEYSNFRRFQVRTDEKLAEP